MQVNNHRHSHTCRRYGGVCRFDFPRWPCLHTILAKPLRLTHEYEQRQEVFEHLKKILLSVRNVLENPELMEKLTQIGSEEMQELYDLKQKKFQIEKILDNPVFKRQVLSMQSDVPKEKLIELEKLIGPFPKKKKMSKLARSSERKAKAIDTKKAGASTNKPTKPPASNKPKAKREIGRAHV